LLTLIIGRAGTGKTLHIMNEIKTRGEAGERELLLLVPEQYSHDAEKQLSAICSDALSLYGETLSFTRLCSHVFTQTGGAAEELIDRGGQILLMHRAVESLGPQLKAFGSKGRRVEFLTKLLDAVREFKAQNVLPETLEVLATRASFGLGDKLHDLALIYNGYDALLHNHGCDSSDRLALLSEMIAESSLGETGCIYFDGFNDFTALEMSVIEELLKKNANVTIALTCDFSDDSEVFDLPKKTAQQLREMANKMGTPYQLLELVEAGITMDGSFDIGTANEKPSKENALNGDFGRVAKSREMLFLEKNLFASKVEIFPEVASEIFIFEAQNRYSECEHAAYLVWKLIREGYRWRDIGVMSRNWEEYGQICENIFGKYDIPYFSSGRANIIDKAPIAIIDAALEIIVSGWSHKNVFRYIKSGLCGISTDECALLENYAIKWKIKGSMWTRDWTLPPLERNDENANNIVLNRLNSLRGKIVEPLVQLQNKMGGFSDGKDKLMALYEFLMSIDLPRQLSYKVAALEKRNEWRIAQEYDQIWAILKNALEQFHAVLGDSKLSTIEFANLLSLMLTQYSVSAIPVSLDRVTLGSMAMSRRRDLKCLIVLGCTDDNMPMLSRSSGVLSEHERNEMFALGALMPAGYEERYSREMNMLYSTLTLPSEKLIMTYPIGDEQHPSYIVKRISSIYQISPITLSDEECMSAAHIPCYELAIASKSIAINDNDKILAAAAREYFNSLSLDESIKLDIIERHITAERDFLTRDIAESLYGQDFLLSASRVDRYYSCPFSHFALNGLQLRPIIPVEFDAPAAGTFTHYVLEGVCREIKETVGFENVSEELSSNLTRYYIEQYISKELFDFTGKTQRFVYLFKRLEENVIRIVGDLVSELKVSDFMPLDFELNFSRAGISGLSGIVDRVDGLIQDETLYLRIVDYKTGRLSFSLSDILYGRNMQMLIYLFALEKYGKARYEMDISPAAVLYMPARDNLIQITKEETDEQINAKRIKELRRSGLLLNEPTIIEALEKGENKIYLPLKSSKGVYSGDSLLSAQQFTLLGEYVDHMLDKAKDEIKQGNIKCTPQYAGESNNACLYCEYKPLCAFDPTQGDTWSYVRKIKPSDVWSQLTINNEQ